MVPIYDSDIAEERWSKAEWNHYELWERVEQRLRKHNRLWIAGTVFVFLLLSSVPIVIEQRPKWRSLSAVRQLGQELNHLKREAAVDHLAYRIRFAGHGSLDFVVEKAAHCDDPVFMRVRSGNLPGVTGDSLVLLTKEQGNAMNVPGLVESFCYDPLGGSQVAAAGESIAAFAIIPSNDLTAGRIDRLSVLLLSGPSADLSFE